MDEPRIRLLTKWAQEGKGMYWKPLRKTTSTVLVAREHREDQLFAENIRLRADHHTLMLDLSVDLNKNLRTRSKEEGTYIDAKDLSESLREGRTSDFKSLTIDDPGVIEDINNVMNRADFAIPHGWRLHLALEGDYWFTVRHEPTTELRADESMTFHVESVVTEHPPL